jgi:hypothetical protein
MLVVVARLPLADMVDADGNQSADQKDDEQIRY